MSELKALLFDVDGTLSDTERDGHRVAFNMAFREKGLAWDWDVALYGELLAVTGGKERIKFFLDKYLPDFTQPDDLKGFLQDLHQTKTKHYTELLSQGRIGLRPGVARLIAEAREQGLRLAIATTTTPENVTALLASTLGIESIDWFELIAAGDIVPAKKPASDIYDYTLEHMKLAPSECVALEDSYNGIRASLGAKLPTVITTNAYTQNDDFTGAKLVVDQLGEPDSPMKVIAGEVDNGYVTVAMLRKLIA